METKRRLRESLRRAIREFAGAGTEARGHVDHRGASDALALRLVDLLRGLPSQKCWAGFWATAHEPDIQRAVNELSDRRWAFPRVEADGLGFYEPSDDQAFVTGAFGIREPDPTRSRPVPLGEIDGFLVPGLAFDTECNRLGRGGGFYDRVLETRSRLNPNLVKVGVSFDRQILTEPIPLEPHDIRMDWVVSESRTLRRAASCAVDPSDERKAP